MKKLLLSAAVLATTALPLLGFAQAATISTTDLTTSGLSVSTGLSNISSPTYISNDGNTILVIKGGPSGPVTVDVVTQAKQMSASGFGTVTLTNQSIVVPSSSIVLAGPWPIGRWNTPTSSTIQVSPSSVTGVSITAVRLP